MRASTISKILIAVATAATLAGCFHVPLRARQNGRELGYTTESSVIYGPHNAAATRRMESAIRSSSMGWQMAKPFSPFGDWNW